jgi:hypothetical protein
MIIPRRTHAIAAMDGDPLQNKSAVLLPRETKQHVVADLSASESLMKLEGNHHLQNPQNRPWYRFCNRLADRPLGRVSCLQEP